MFSFFKKKSKDKTEVEVAKQDIVLDVPFSQKDEAKSFGARWNPKIKKWFIPSGINKIPLQRWIPENKVISDSDLVVKSRIYLIQSQESCYKCNNKTEVFCIAGDGILFDEDDPLNSFVRIFHVESLPKKLSLSLKERAPTYYVDYSRTANGNYYMNHCKCGAKLGDFFMHCEPGGAFLPMYKEDVKGISILDLSINDNLKVKASYGTDDQSLIPKHAKRRSN